MTVAEARVAAERAAGAGPPSSRLCALRSGWPLMLRAVGPDHDDGFVRWAARDVVPVRAHVAAGGAGPLGGDQFTLTVDVGPGSAMLLGEVSPTLLLPGRDGATSRTRVEIRVGAGATLVWLPRLVIAARGCRHRTDVRVSADVGARLLLREEVLAGRHGEEPGDLRQRVRLTVGGVPVYDQELSVGPTAPGWDGPAVAAGRRALGSLLIRDPGLRLDPRSLADARADVAVMPLAAAGGAVVSALAADTLTLRRHLDAALADVLC